MDYNVLRMCVLHSRMGNIQLIESHYRATKAGFAGEEKVLRYIRESHMSRETRVFHNVIMDGAQLDVIVVNPRFICVLEVKNMIGEFHFGADNHQFYRVTGEGKKEGMRNPELQLQRAIKVVQRRLHRKQVDVHVHGIIVLVSRSGLVVEAPRLFPAIPIDALVDMLEKMERLSNDRLSSEDLKVARRLMKSDGVDVYDKQLFERLNIDKQNLRPGVRCSMCFSVGMKRIYSTWVCIRCGCRDKHAHLATLQEYQLLFGREITSAKVNWWLAIEDKYLVKRILKQVSEESYGTNRNRNYQLRFEPGLLEQFLRAEMKKR